MCLRFFLFFVLVFVWVFVLVCLFVWSVVVFCFVFLLLFHLGGFLYVLLCFGLVFLQEFHRILCQPCNLDKM